MTSCKAKLVDRSWNILNSVAERPEEVHEQGAIKLVNPDKRICDIWIDPQEKIWNWGLNWATDLFPDSEGEEVETS